MTNWVDKVLSQRTPLVACVLAVLIGAWLVFAAGRLLGDVSTLVKYQLATPPSVGVLASNTAAVALMPVLLLCAYFLRDRAAPPDGQTDSVDSGLPGIFANLLAILLGTAVGWALAVFWVPFDEEDGQIYSRIGAGVTAFMSGVVLGYVAPIVKEQLKTRQTPFLVQVALGSAALLLTALTVVINRTEYLETARLERAEENAVATAEKARIEQVKAEFAPQFLALRLKRLQERNDRVLRMLAEQGSRTNSTSAAVGK